MENSNLKEQSLDTFWQFFLANVDFSLEVHHGFAEVILAKKSLKTALKNLVEIKQDLSSRGNVRVFPSLISNENI